MQNTPPTTEERIWAVLSHLSALAFGMGILLPVIGWSEQRRKSKYVSFQCLQALGYQSLGYTVWVLSFLLWVVLFAIVMLVVISAQPETQPDSELFAGLWTGILVVTMFGLFAIYFILPVIAAVACGLGRDFRYPLLGNRLARYLGYQPSTPDAGDMLADHEERWVTAMGHFAVIIPLWGLIAPITAWILQGSRSTFVKFQSIQTAAYQVITNVLYLGSGFVYLIGVVPLILLAGFDQGSDISQTGIMAGLSIFLIFTLIAAIMVLVLPLLHIIGQWAGYRVLKGDDYHYPLIGRLVQRRLAR